MIMTVRMLMMTMVMMMIMMMHDKLRHDKLPRYRTYFPLHPLNKLCQHHYHHYIIIAKRCVWKTLWSPV